MLTHRTLVHDADLQELEARLLALPAGSDVGWDCEYWGPKVDDDKLDDTQLRCVGYGLSVGDDTFYVPCRHTEGVNAREPAWRHLLSVLVDCTARLRVWGWSLGGAELQLLTCEGIQYGGRSDAWYDGMVAAWLAGWGTEKDTKLKRLASSRLGGDFPDFKAVAKGRACWDIPVAELGPYCGKDAWLGVRFGVEAYDELDEELRRHYHEIDMPCVEPVRRMQHVGMAVDAAALRTLGDQLQREADELALRFLELTTTALQCAFPVSEVVGTFKNGKRKTKRVAAQLWDIRGALPGSDRDVSRWCYEVIKVWPSAHLKRTGTGFFPTDKETIEQFIPLGGLAAELVQLRMDWQMRNKLLSTYIKPLLDLPGQYRDGRIHPRQALCGTESQRFSCSGPNFQNLPSRSKEGKRVRDAVIAGPGRKLVVVDMNQAELRIAAHLSQDPELSLCYHLAEDVHAGTLAALHAQGFTTAERIHAKTTNFSCMYSITAPTLAVKAKTTEANAELMIGAFYTRFASLLPFHLQCYAYVTKHGNMRTIDGFRRPLDNKLVRDWRTRDMGLAWSVKNQCANTAVQGSVAGLAKIVLVRIHRLWSERGWLGTRAELVMTEHDSIIAEVDADVAEQAAAEIKQAMETTWQLRVPFVADAKIGLTWAQCK